jgi:hypothetical protein
MSEEGHVTLQSHRADFGSNGARVSLILNGSDQREVRVAAFADPREKFNKS